MFVHSPFLAALLGNSLITPLTTTIGNQSIFICITGYYLVYPSLVNSSFMIFHHSFLSYYTFLVSNRKLVLMSFMNGTLSISKTNLYDDPRFILYNTIYV